MSKGLKIIKFGSSKPPIRTNDEFKEFCNNFPYDYDNSFLHDASKRLPKFCYVVKKRMKGEDIIKNGLVTEEEKKQINKKEYYTAPFIDRVDIHSVLTTAHKRGGRTLVLQALKRMYETHVYLMNLKNEANVVKTYFVK